MLAIVILNFNGKNFLQQFLPVLLEHSRRHTTDVYIADNASTDDSLDFVETHFPTVKTIRLARNFGFAEGYNQALKDIRADYYLLLNSDVEVSEGWLQPMIDLLNSNERIAAVQPKIRSWHDRHLLEHAGGAGGFMDALGYPLCKGRIVGALEPDNGQYDTVSECFWATGACMLVRAHLFHELGGFDGDYFAHMEEIDWCWRAKRAGYQIMVQPACTVYHVGGGTLPTSNPRKTYLNFHNSLVTILKNEPLTKCLWNIPLRLILDGVAGVKFLFEGNFMNIVMIIKAHWVFFGTISKVWHKRRRYTRLIVQHKIAERNDFGVLPTSIVFDHFIKGKTTFQDLIK
jgi:GT2 family glycosyltransferase